MGKIASSLTADVHLAAWQEVYPALRALAIKAFRHERNRAQRDDDCADLLAIIWRRWERNRKSGRAPFKSARRLVRDALYHFIVRGERVGRSAATDMLDHRTAARHGYRVERLEREDGTTETQEGLAALASDHDNPADLACARLLYAEFVAKLEAREESLLEALMARKSSRQWAREYGLSKKTASRVRQAMREKMMALCPDL
jgi:hypothetical protein